MPKRGLPGLGDLSGKRALVRVDFNVPLDTRGDAPRVADDYRLLMAMDTIQALRERGAAVILASHLGRPSGPDDSAFSLQPVAARLSELLGQPVRFAPDTVGPAATKLSESLGAGEVGLIENLRFQKGEKKGDPEFADALAKLADVYVNDAFGVCHRGDASVALLPERLPAACGGLIQREVEHLTPLREGTALGPVTVVLGGAKLDDKIPVLRALLPKADHVLVGGGMAYTFLKLQGQEVGGSRVSESAMDEAREILALAEQGGASKLLLPSDHAIGQRPDGPEGYAVAESIPSDRMGLDVGPKTLARYAEVLQSSQTVFWNGPLGVFEQAPFDLGTRYVATVIGYLEGVTSIVGGGDSAAAARSLGLAERMSWVSTGGGASMEYVCGADLPGLAALPEAS